MQLDVVVNDLIVALGLELLVYYEC
jgi:hypothetical protein